MPCAKFAGGVVCYNNDYFIKDATGKVWHFEWHRFCGPMALSVNSHEPLKRIPGERSPFWDAVTRWHSQGKKTKAEDGKVWAQWEEK